MKIHLLRHAKTEQFSANGKDFDRELAQKGKLQCQHLNHFFKSFDLRNISFLISSAKRTSQTFHSTFSKNCKTQFLENLYLAPQEELLRAIVKETSNEDVFLIGHNEGISDLASYLSGKSLHLKTAEYICLAFDVPTSDYVSGGIGEIITQYRPYL